MNPPFDVRHARREAERCLQCFDAPCTAACPAHIDVPRFILSLRTENLRGAAQVIRHANAMAHVCGCVCPEEVFCQAACTRGKQDAPVEIRGLHRFVTRTAADRGFVPPPAAPAAGKSVAVIGAGPAGLTCAVELAKRGVTVRVFERSLPGGVPASSIPPYRLPAEELAVDVKHILQRVELRPGEVTPALFDRIRAEHDAVFVSVGLGRDRMPRIPGIGLQGVLAVLPFLERARSVPDAAHPGRRVVVIGGGNVSLDAAATARRLGAEEVILLYRRGEPEMRVWKAELEEVRRSGVELRYFAHPVEITGNTAVNGIRCRRTRLGRQVDSTGRRVPEEIPGTDFLIETEAVIVAIGQDSGAPFLDGFDRTTAGYLTVDGEYRTSIPGVFAGGDVIGGEGTVVQAVAQGKAAARHMAKAMGIDDGR